MTNKPRIVRDVACPHCGAAAGEPCHGPKGDKLSATHTAREHQFDRAAAEFAKMETWNRACAPAAQ